MNRQDRTAAVFGQRTLAALPASPASLPVRLLTAFTCGVVAFGLLAIAMVWAPSAARNIATDQAATELRVVTIVNQPVTHLPRTDQAEVFSPGWFHPGAQTPDFAHVDIRDTQQKIYDDDDYVTSDMNPSEMFVGRELEFNAMTKYFYHDRSLPKKKLSESEMLEINGLYREIERDRKAWVNWGERLAALLAAASFLAVVSLRLAFRPPASSDMGRVSAGQLV